MCEVLLFEREVEPNYIWKPTSSVDRKDTCEKAEFLISFSNLFFISYFRLKIRLSFKNRVMKHNDGRETDFYIFHSYYLRTSNLNSQRR